MIVSIIIPCYNVEKYIAECLQSVLAQTYKDIEIICVDNNSTDNTLSLLTRFATEYSSFITLIQEKEKGAPCARNKGIAEAKGEYIQFLDADDLLLPDKIKIQAKLAKENNNPDIIYADYYLQHVNGNKKIVESDKSDIWLGLMYTQLGKTSSNLFKTSVVKQLHGFDTKLESSQEYDLMFRMLKQGSKCCYDTTANTIIRERKEGSISQLHVKENMIRYLQLRKDILNYLLQQNIAPDKMQNYYQAVFDSIRMLHNHSSDEALAEFKKIIPKNFKPKANAVNSSSYILIYNLFGFKRAEKIKKVIK